ncbi:hypothetical protein KCV87_13375 [Actinosynnema pretiosum subsp. pretiosum]|nr:hypothetical protein [Actinosynnema mirum]QUF06942.1 hypothetical protein KCV87_13375 [Actinosynnema pretiosum subsp. pretiosum]
MRLIFTHGGSPGVGGGGSGAGQMTFGGFSGDQLAGTPDKCGDTARKAPGTIFAPVLSVRSVKIAPWM